MIIAFFKRLDPPHSYKNYLTDIDEKHKRLALSKIRLGSHNFYIERGRWYKKKITERLCPTCNTVEDEYHIFIECPDYHSLRKQYLPYTLLNRPSMYKFINYVNNLNKKDMYKFSTLCFKLLKKYDENMLA